MILNFAFNFLSKNIRRSLLSVFLIVVSTLVIMLSVILSENRDEVYETIDTHLVCGVERTAKLDIRYDDVEPEKSKELYFNMKNFLDDISDEHEINSIGSYHTFGCVPIPELYEIQKKGNATSGEYMKVTDIYKHAANMFNLKLTSGVYPSELDFESDIGYLYLGSGFEGFIEPGEMYEIKSRKYEVAGILDESQIFLDDNFTSEISATSYSAAHDMKYGILCFGDNIPSSGFWLGANKGYNINQAIEKLYSVAEKYDMEDYILYTTLNDKYEMANKEWLFIKNILYKLITIVCISCILMLICTHILDLLSQMRNYGIMYANGFSISDISKIITIKNIAVSVFAFLISIIICLLAVNLIFKGSEDMSDVFNRIIVHIAIPLSLSVIGLITVFITLFSIVILRKLSPLRMIGGQND